MRATRSDPDEIAPDEIAETASHRVNWHLTGQAPPRRHKDTK
ncbi:MAG: hypothetical protein ABSE89_09340 [Sedimentisphaerales bacterium]